MTHKNTINEMLEVKNLNNECVHSKVGDFKLEGGVERDGVGVVDVYEEGELGL